MSRIQNILDKAEREGAALRTCGLGSLDVPATATVPITIEIPSRHAPAVDAPAIVPAAPHTSHAHESTSPSASSADGIESFTVRLNPVLIAGLSPKSLAAEQYRQLRTRLSHAEGATALRTSVITSPQ
jgi:hypothetical protein